MIYFFPTFYIKQPALHIQNFCGLCRQEINKEIKHLFYLRGILNFCFRFFRMKCYICGAYFKGTLENAVRPMQTLFLLLKVITIFPACLYLCFSLFLSICGHCCGVVKSKLLFQSSTWTSCLYQLFLKKTVKKGTVEVECLSH